MVCLFVLRRKEPHLARPYRVPIYPVLPAFVAVLSGIAAFLYGWANVQIIVPTVVLYAAAGLWYVAWARKRVLAVAPEEVAARIAEELAHRAATRPAPDLATAAVSESPTVVTRTTGPILLPSDPLYLRQAGVLLERVTAPLLLLGLLSMLWMVLRATGILRPVLPETAELLLFGGLWAVLFVVVSLVGLLSTVSKSADSD
jgi:hypothetical protein